MTTDRTQKNIDPTKKDADALLAFLPFVDWPGHSFQSGSSGGQTLADGTLTMPYPVYGQGVVDFFRLAGQPCWMNTEYHPGRTAKMLDDFLKADETERAKTDLADFRTMLTYCVQGERFCEGHWAEMLSSGTMSALLKRLAQIQLP